jgi:hypothetical protein
MSCTPPQQILLDLVTQVWGDPGLNVLAVGSFPTGSGDEIRRICYVSQGEANIKPLTHGFAVRIDNAAKYQPGNYSPKEARDQNSCGLIADLYLPQDINTTEYAATVALLNAQGIAPPLAVEFMNDATDPLQRAIKDHPEIASVRGGLMQRGVYGGEAVIARLKLDVIFKIRTGYYETT